jgi:predicted DNA-binding protein YlxM (UPF0122 family)
MIGGLSFLDKEGRFATLFEIYEALLTQSNPCHFG